MAKHMSEHGPSRVAHDVTRASGAPSGVPSGGSVLIDALNLFSEALVRALPSREGVCTAAAGALSSVGLRGAVTLLEPRDGHLVVQSLAAPEGGRLTTRLVALTGIDATGYSFHPDRSPAYQEVMSEREALFVVDSSSIVLDLMPPVARPFAAIVLRAFGGGAALLAQIRGRDGVLGVLSAVGPTLSETDGAALVAFARHVGLALEQVRLIESCQRMQEDVRQRKERCGAAIRAEQERYGVLFRGAEDALFLVGLGDGAPHGRILEANEAACRRLGYSTQELGGLTLYDVISGEAHEAVSSALAGLGPDRCMAVPASQVTRSGQLVPVELRGHRFELDGAPVALLIARDVSARRRAEAEREQALELLQSTIDGVDEPILVIGMDHTIQLSNRASRAAHGIGEESETPRFCYEMSHRRSSPCTGEKDPCPLERIRRSARPVKVVHEHDDGRGGVRFQEIVASPLFDSEGRLAGIIEASHDVTERRRTEEELFRARKLESVALLAGGIAHDFNNLLAVIQGNVSIAKSGASDELTHATLADAETACRRAADLTRQLLTFAKGGAPIRRAASLDEVIRESARFATRGSSVSLEIDIQEGLLPVEVDIGQIHQVVQNLILNAVQAMPGSGTIRIRGRNDRIEPGHPTLVGGRYVRIEVEDDGCGIAPEIVGRVFDPYFTTKPAGSGLGLATAWSIVRNHSGLLDVASVAGTGSIFTILLPACVCVQELLGSPVPPEPPPSSGTGRVLVMDDDEPVRRVAGRMLERLGYEVELAVDGEEAVAAYKRALSEGRRFDAVILDLTVPGGVGGERALLELRALDPDVNALVSSGYATDPVIAHHDEYGFRGVVTKPYSTEQMGAALAAII